MSIGRITSLSSEPSCPYGRCDGSGWILDDDDFSQECECRPERMARKRQRGVASAIPARYRGVSFDRPPISDIARKPEGRHVVDTVRRYVEDLDAQLEAGRGLWFMGDVGTGKTSLAMLISQYASQAKRTTAIYSLPRLLARIRRTFDADPGEESYLSFFERLTSVDLLQIDDLGAEKSSEWVLEQLYALIDERYVSERAVVVTTNLDLPDLEAQIGPRTVSRLIEICGDPLRLVGDDLRLHGEDTRFRAA